MDNFMNFYKHTYKMVSYTMRRYGLQKEDREDLCQEVYVRALEQWDVIKDHPNIVGWTRTTIWNVYRTYARKPKLPLFANYEELLEVPYEENGYEAIVMDNLLESVYGAEDKRLIEAYSFEGYSIAELSRVCDISSGNMRTRMYRMRKKLKRYIESYT